jgi:hypothetical protein
VLGIAKSIPFQMRMKQLQDHGAQAAGATAARR